MLNKIKYVLFLLICSYDIIYAIEFTLPVEVLRNEVSIGVVDIKAVFDTIVKEEKDKLEKERDDVMKNLSKIQEEIKNAENERNSIDMRLEMIDKELPELLAKKEKLKTDLLSITATGPITEPAPTGTSQESIPSVSSGTETTPSTETGSVASSSPSITAPTLTAIETELQKIEDTIKQKEKEKNDLTIKRKEKEQIILQKQQELENKKKEEETKLLKKEEDISLKVYETIYSKIVELAKYENIDIIMDKNLLLYNEKVKDFTTTLINMLLMK